MQACWTAPGRINLIGEHLDYNGGLVLPFAIDRAARAEVAITPFDHLRVESELGRADVAWPLDRDRVEPWARYIVGAVWAFIERFPGRFEGLSVAVSSTVPVGAGLSSSAAVECAVICALDELAGTRLSRDAVAALALHGEREFVGVPCGPMDHLASMFGAVDEAVLIDCETLVTSAVPLPLSATGLMLLAIDTRVQHSLAGGAYAERVDTCLRAASALGVSRLVEADPDAVERLRDPELRRRARHVVSEQRRVHDVVDLLNHGGTAAIGSLLTTSHRSLADDFEVSCPELDLAVEAALTAGALGARLTGAGLGGTVIALCPLSAADPITERVRARFAERGLREPRIWSTRPGAGARRCSPR